jgi:hypothetical protein
MEPRATFDAEAGALVVELADGVVSGTIAYPDDAHLIDVDAEGRALSLEILDPDHLLIDQMASRFGFEDQAATIAAAVDAVLPAHTAATAFGEISEAHVLVNVSAAVHATASSSASASSWAPARELDLTK